MGLCVYPGSFDPVTNGHLDLIERGAKLFPELIVAVLNNPQKRGFFSVERRLAMLATVCAHLPNVRLDSFDGLLADYMRKTEAGIVLRGLRAVSDFESEFQMAQVNHQIFEGMETLFLMTSPHNGYVSSSIVREIGAFGGDVSAFVPGAILEEVRGALITKTAGGDQQCKMTRS